MKHADGLCEKKQGKHVLLTMDEEIGHAMFTASQHSPCDEGIIRMKAAKIIRKRLFCEYEVFNGDRTLERQVSSVPRELIHLVSLILEGNSQSD